LRPVSKACAIWVVRAVLKDLVGAGGASQAAIEFDSDPVPVRDVHAALEDLSGGDRGWRILLRKAGMEDG
jgi:hypothetical protein